MAAAAVAMFFCRAAQQGNMGLFLVISGAALLIFPPRIRIDWRIWAFAMALPVLASLALLPHRWFPELSWRQTLAAAGVALPSSITPHPSETLFWLSLLAVAVSIGLFGLAHPLGSRMQLLLAGAAAALSGVYTCLAMHAYHSGREYPYAPDSDSFGFFPNRNHMATFLVMGSVLSLGILSVAFRRRHWLAGVIATASLAVCVWALVFVSISRGGILFLLAGTALWLAGLGRTHRTKPLLISFAAIFLGGLLLLLGSKSVVRHRIFLLAGWERSPVMAMESQPIDGRILIFQDTLALIRDFPLTGCGLGAFRYVFPQYRKNFALNVPVIHPESDWLMLASEAGVPALLTLLAGIGWLMWRVWPLRQHPYWPLRWGILCAALAALLHGCIDVPAHRPALGWWILAMAGLGFQVSPRAPTPPPRIQHLLFIAAGAAAIALGLPMLRAEWLGGRSSPPLAAYAEQANVIGLRVDGRLPEAVEAARKALTAAPLVEVLYYQLAVTLLRLDANAAEVDTLLHAQRLLNPISSQIPIDQGDLWLESDPEKTALLWLEAIRRAESVDRLDPFQRGSALLLFQRLLTRASAAPAVQRQLFAICAERPEFTLSWLELAEPGAVAAELPRLAETAAFRDALTESARGRFLAAWYRKGDRDQLFQWIAGQAEWQRAAWPMILRRMVEAGQFAEAAQASATHFGFSLTLPEPGNGDAGTPPVVDETRASSFERFWRKGNVLTARRILEDARAAPPPVEPEIWRLSAAVCAREGDWRNAWQHLERYLQARWPASAP